MEYILLNCSKEDITAIETSGIDWYPDDVETNNICVDSEEDFLKALELLRRRRL